MGGGDRFGFMQLDSQEYLATRELRHRIPRNTVTRSSTAGDSETSCGMIGGPD